MKVKKLGLSPVFARGLAKKAIYGSVTVRSLELTIGHDKHGKIKSFCEYHEGAYSNRKVDGEKGEGDC
jgi:hypothetical protein